ncbi:hypothetical protein DASC09_061290 [Saccharomycopsis crataegensis]|uniref:WW domain-containing protein n=1 Tax=Saccharomycopsis crataegensis TaxID=43959 RepID=A0AAV5QW02_9ASCO|nr:hypothetical protein DASC09_061290 [Saccharomycopsis crataegensis]
MSTVISWKKQYDHQLKTDYYINTSTGSITFDTPSEVRSPKKGKKFAISCILKQKWSKLSLCRSKSNNSNNNNNNNNNNTGSIGSDASQNDVDDEKQSADASEQGSMEYTYSAPLIFNTSHHDDESVISFESYVSSIDESMIHETANQFYNGGRVYEEDKDDNRSLTLMSPDDFDHDIVSAANYFGDYTRDNIDDYDSDIQSLHDDEDVSSPHYFYSPGAVGMTRESTNSTADEDYTMLTENQLIHSDLLSKQLNREMLRFEEEYLGY